MTGPQRSVFQASFLNWLAQAWVRSTATAGWSGSGRACPWWRSGWPYHAGGAGRGWCGCRRRRPGVPLAGVVGFGVAAGYPGSGRAGASHGGWPRPPLPQAGYPGSQRRWSACGPACHGRPGCARRRGRRRGRWCCAPVDGEVIKLQADDAVVGVQHQQLQGGEDAQADPVVAAVADGGRRAGLVGDLAVAAAKRQDLHQLVEHDPVGDASPVAATKGMDWGGRRRGRAAARGTGPTAG
jgi:hypothetical protein